MFVFSAIHDLYTGRVYVCCLGSRLKNLQDIFSLLGGWFGAHYTPCFRKKHPLILLAISWAKLV